MMRHATANPAPANSAPIDAGHPPTASAAGRSDEEEPFLERSREPIPLDQKELSPEIADKDALARLSDWSRLPVFDASKTRQLSSEDRRGASQAEATIYPFLSDGNRDVNNFVCRSADAKLSLMPSVPYLYDTDACAEDYVHGVVLARFEGSGRLRRFHLAAYSLSGRGGSVLMDEMLRFYTDDNPRPLVQLSVSQIASGADEIFTTPFSSIGQEVIAWYYPLVFSSKLIIALDNLSTDYAHVADVAMDETPRRRVASTKRSKLRDDAHSRLLTDSPVPADAMLRTEQIMLTANGTREVSFDGPGTIQQLRLRVPKDQLASLAPVRIAVSWDNASERAVDVPLLSLFAATRSPPPESSLALESMEDGSDRVLSLRLPMPFRTRASWTISSTSADAAGFSLEWSTNAGVPTEDFGHLHVQLREPQLPLREISQTVAQARTRGRIVGVCGDLAGRTETAFGSSWEDPLYFANGDVYASADGENVTHEPATNMYIDDYGFFAKSPKTTPFVQRWNRVQDNNVEPPGQLSFCRWHILGNEIDSKNELIFSRAAAQRDLTTVDLHRTVAYLYLP